MQKWNKGIRGPSDCLMILWICCRDMHQVSVEDLGSVPGSMWLKQMVLYSHVIFTVQMNGCLETFRKNPWKHWQTVPPGILFWKEMSRSGIYVSDADTGISVMVDVSDRGTVIFHRNTADISSFFLIWNMYCMAGNSCHFSFWRSLIHCKRAPVMIFCLCVTA